MTAPQNDQARTDAVEHMLEHALHEHLGLTRYDGCHLKLWPPYEGSIREFAKTVIEHFAGEQSEDTWAMKINLEEHREYRKYQAERIRELEVELQAAKAFEPLYINSQEEFEAALARLNEIFHTEDPEEIVELTRLSKAIESYESGYCDAMEKERESAKAPATVWLLVKTQPADDDRTFRTIVNVVAAYETEEQVKAAFDAFVIPEGHTYKMGYVERDFHALPAELQADREQAIWNDVADDIAQGRVTDTTDLTREEYRARLRKGDAS